MTEKRALHSKTGATNKHASETNASEAIAAEHLSDCRRDKKRQQLPRNKTRSREPKHFCIFPPTAAACRPPRTWNAKLPFPPVQVVLP